MKGYRFEPDDLQYAVAFIVLSSVGGTSIRPVVGGFVEQYLPWYWNFGIQLIFGVAVQAVRFFVPETRGTVMLGKEAKRRKASETDIYGPSELKEKRMDFKEFMMIWTRPFVMFVREPIVLCLSLPSGSATRSSLHSSSRTTPSSSSGGSALRRSAWLSFRTYWNSILVFEAEVC